MVKRERLGPYTLSWPEGVFPLGGDALALGAFSSVKPGWRVCDLGTGSGALLLLLARRAEGLDLTGIDLHPPSAALCPPEALIWPSPTRPTFRWAAAGAAAPPAVRSTALWTSCAPPPDGW